MNPTPNPYHLFLDDQRVPAEVTWIDLPRVEWTLARSFDQFVAIIIARGIPATVSFDHDLDPAHYHAAAAPNPQLPIPYHSFKVKTGLHAAAWLKLRCRFLNVPLPTCYVHTLNPRGQQNIRYFLGLTHNHQKP